MEINTREFVSPRPAREDVSLDSTGDWVVWTPATTHRFLLMPVHDERPNLARDFVGAVGKAEDVRPAFALFGPLFVDWIDVIATGEYRERVADWLDASHTLSAAWALLNALREGDATVINRIMAAADAPPSASGPDGLPVLSGTELADVARIFGRHEMPLHEQVLSTLATLTSNNLSREVDLRIEAAGAGVGFRMEAVPRSLYGVLWLDLASTLIGDYVTARCEWCGDWFTMTPSSARRNKRYCSDKCRVAAHRARKQIDKGGGTNGKR